MEKYPQIKDQSESVKSDIQLQLMHLLQNGASLQDIAKVIGAEDYLENVGKGKNAVTRLNIREFEQKRKSEQRTLHLPDDYIKIDDVILPPSSIELDPLKRKDGSFKEREVIPRVQMFAELLSDMDLDFTVVEGKNSEKMMRELSYYIFSLPAIRKIAFVNDEKGNATFVLHDVDSMQWREYMAKTKEELCQLPPGAVSIVHYPTSREKDRAEKWKTTIKDVLENNVHTDILEKGESFEQWMSVGELARSLNISHQFVQRMADIHREEHPEWYRFFVSKNVNRELEHLSPELIDLVRAEFEDVKTAPEGWENPNALAKSLGVYAPLVRNIAEKNKLSHPQWFKKYRNLQGKTYEHYAPELVKIITEDFNKYELVPVGWQTVSSLAKKLNVDGRTINSYLIDYREHKSDHFRKYRNNRNTVLEYISPDVSRDIIEKYGTVEPAPDGWISVHTMIKELGSVAKKSVENYRLQNPDNIKIYKNTIGQSVEHVSSSAYESIKKALENITTPPKGWLNTLEISKQIGVAHSTVNRRLQVYKESHPEWFNYHKNSIGHIIEYYAPELIKKIQIDFNDLFEVPKGWVGIREVVSNLGIAKERVRDFAEKYIEENPQWYRNVVNKKTGRRNLYYHPDLVSRIKVDLQEKEDVNTWKTPQQICKILKMDPRTFSSFVTKYKKNYPGWVKNIRFGNEKNREIYSPELIQKMLNDRNEEQVPKDWLTPLRIASVVHVDRRTVKKYAEEYRSKRPEWFKTIMALNGASSEYYAPELISMIKEKIEEERIRKVIQNS